MSPDLTPLDFFLLGILKKQSVRNQIPANIDELRERIIQCSNVITQEMLQKVTDNVYARLGHRQVAGGEQFEHLIK